MPPPSVSPPMPVVEMMPPVRGQTERVRGVVEVAPRRAALGARRAGRGVDAHVSHAGQVEHDAVVAGAEPRHAVAAAANGEIETGLPGEVDGGDAPPMLAARTMTVGCRSIIPFCTARAASYPRPPAR